MVDLENLIKEYYVESAGKDGKKKTKLNRIIDKILKSYGGIYDKDIDDFYSLGNEVITMCVKQFNPDKEIKFNTFLITCLTRKIQTEITKKNREKRKIDKQSVPFSTVVEINKDGSEITIEDYLMSDYNLELEVMENINSYNDNVQSYLNSLTKIEHQILMLIIDGYTTKQIEKKLHISNSMCMEYIRSIKSYEKVRILL